MAESPLFSSEEERASKADGSRGGYGSEGDYVRCYAVYYARKWRGPDPATSCIPLPGREEGYLVETGTLGKSEEEVERGVERGEDLREALELGECS